MTGFFLESHHSFNLVINHCKIAVLTRSHRNISAYSITVSIHYMMNNSPYHQEEINMLIAVINESTMVTNAQCNTMCKAIQVQLDLHVLPAWNMKSATITFYADKTKVPGYAWVVNMLDDSTQAGALGYHSLDAVIIK